MSWDYRVIRDNFTLESGEDIPFYYIGEVYYNDNGTPEAYSGPIRLDQDSFEELEWQYDVLRIAFTKPILEAWE